MKTLSLRALVSAIGLLVAVTTAVTVPVGYFVTGYANIASVLDFKAELNARQLAKYIYTHETLWQYQRVRLAELLAQTDGRNEPIRKRVVAESGQPVLEEGRQPAAPVLARSVPIVVAGTTVGRIELETSLRPMLRNTGVVAIFSIVLGFGMYFAVRVFPLKVLDRTLGNLESTNRRFDAALNNMAQGLVMFDGEHRLVVVNQPFSTMFSVAQENFRVGMTEHEFLDVIIRERNLPEARAKALRAQQKYMIEHGRTMNYLLSTSDGRAVSVMHAPMSNGGWVTTYLDVTARHQAEAKVAHMAHHDALTNLPNRVRFRDRLEESLGRVRRGASVAALCLDLDHFKSVNDTLGHPIGDKLLQTVAHRLRDCVRETDAVARVGGDEFAVIQIDIDQPGEAAALASRLIDVVSAPYDIDGHQVVIGLSIGIAIAPGDATDPDQLLKNADMALYRAKADGRSTYHFFESGMDARAQARRLLELDLRAALKNGEFEVYYQPIVRLREDEVIGFEALVRWHHPQRGMVPPLEFIPLAEETGLIVPLGDWVLRTACSEAVRWSKPVRVAVNLSPVQFKNRHLVQSVMTAIAASGLAPGRLELEITESVLLNDSEATLATLHQLRSFGVRISMDDFGTGYSSLSYLRSFPFDKIKIDRSFIEGLSSREDCLAIVRAVTSLGSSLGIATTAEGVETAEQLELLRSEGCTEVQGYIFSAPRPAAEVERLLAVDSRERAVA